MLLEDPLALLRTILPFLVVVAAVVLCLVAGRWLLLRRSLALGDERRLPRQLVLLGLGLVGIIIIVLALPVTDDTRNQLLTVLGLLASAIIGLSSTTLIANAMSGLMLRTTRSFRTGNFIRVGDYFGRVTERRLLHTEIQTESRQLTTLPNVYLIANPVTVVRTSGTLVSATLSLGYDVHHDAVEPLLLEAARRADLEEPFVWIMELGNFAITYRISGFLADIKNLLTVRSNLCKRVLDVLHDNGVEIVSPAFMNQRPLPEDRRFIPAAPAEPTPKPEESPPEDIMFDKADRAERIESRLSQLRSEIKELEGRLQQAEGEERKRLEENLTQLRKKADILADVKAKAGA
jgi:small conductance mechanosensitive channel